MILNDISQGNDNVLEENRNEDVKFHRLERSMGEAMSIFQSVVEVEQRNGGPQKNTTWQKIKNFPACQTRNRGWTNPTRYGN